MDLTLSLTHDCNLDCTYCYGGRKRRASMSREVASRALDLALAHTGRGGALQLSFFGGEPLLEWELLVWCALEAEARAAAASVDLLLTVTTNATLLDRPRGEWLAAHRVSVAASVDGSRESQDLTRRPRGRESCGSSFDQALAGLHVGLELFPRLEVVAVVDPVNVDLVAAGARFLADEGVPVISLNPNFAGHWTPDRLAAWERQYAEVADLYVERLRAGCDLSINFVDAKVVTRLLGGFPCADRCGFGEREVSVAPSGRLYPCERLVGEDTGERSIGHVDTGFDEEARRRVLSCRGNADAACLECTARRRCVNWCACANLATTGTTDHAGGLVCFHEQLAIREADRAAALLWAERNPIFLRRFYGERA
jgi:uncharacterized protein